MFFVSMKRSAVVLFFLAVLNLHGQELFEGRIGGLAGQKAYLGAIYGEKVTVFDSTLADLAGNVRFSLAGRLPGMYRIRWSKDGFVDLVWNREYVKFSTTAKDPYDSLRILASDENRINREFSAMDRMNQERLQLLVPVIDHYPVKDAFYRETAREMERIQKQQQHFIDSVAALHPKAFALRMARVYQSPFIPASLTRDDRMNYLKQHYFDKVDFSDTALLRSQVFANKAISYLALYSNNRLQQKQLEAEFIKAVTIMLGAASVNPETYKFLLDYVVGGFDKFHFDEVITYIADNFQDPTSCEDQERKSALQKKLETFKKIAIGKTAPELDIPDAKGNPFRLSALNAEYTLLVFWHTGCSHCTAMMPRLRDIYDNQKPKRFEVVAVAIDTSRTEWTGFIKEERLGWINISDLKGFSGKPADDYNIYATPTMFLLDREKKILAKPVSSREMEQVLRDYSLMR